MKTSKRILAAVVSIASVASLMAMSVSAETPAETGKNSYSFDFTKMSATDVEKSFAPYFLEKKDDSTDAGKTGKAEAFKNHWSIDGNGLARAGLVKDALPSTDTNNAMLYLKDATFKYFEAEYSFNFGDSYGWAQLCFNAQGIGNHMFHSNSGVFMQQEGYVNLSFPGGDYKKNETDKKAYTEGFDKKKVQTIKVRQEKGSADGEMLITIQAKQADGEYVTIVKNHKVTDQYVANPGHISLQAQNDNVKFLSLNITRLDEKGNPVKDASSDNNNNNNNNNNNPSTGVGAPIVAVVTLAGAAIAVVATKKRASK